MRRDQRLRPGQARFEQRQPGRRVAQHTGDREHVAGPGPGPGHRIAPGQITQRGDREHNALRPGGVAADHGRAHPGALVGNSRYQFLCPRQRKVSRCRKPDEQGNGDRAHSGHVGQVLRRGFPTDIGWIRPIPAEMQTL